MDTVAKYEAKKVEAFKRKKLLQDDATRVAKKLADVEQFLKDCDRKIAEAKAAEAAKKVA